MCCIFTCCGWMVDLIQRFWSFAMSCCISSAVCCLLVMASMSGIALGYNYSLAEYIDLKETNVSVFLKRGIFDDEIQDLQLRRDNEGPSMRRSGSESGTPTADFDASTTLRSGRRLDDSVFESGDQNKYEGSLMRLTARPPFSATPAALITGDNEMQEIALRYTKDSLDSLKAIQSLLDARRSYVNSFSGRTTLTPIATYPFNEPERVAQQIDTRRMMGNDNPNPPSMNPARLAVPEQDIGSDIYWRAPVQPELYKSKFKDYGFDNVPITFPTAITFNLGPVRSKPTTANVPDNQLYLTRTSLITLFSTRGTDIPEVRVYTKDPKVLSFKEKVMAENELPPRKLRPKSDEEYDYDIKGLPVRKRRGANFDEFINKAKIFREDSIPSLTFINDKDELVSQHSKINNILSNSDIIKKVTDKVKDKSTEQRKGNSESYLKARPHKKNFAENKFVSKPASAKIKVDNSIPERDRQNLFAHLMSNLDAIKNKLNVPFSNVKCKSAYGVNVKDQTTCEDEKMSSAVRNLNVKEKAVLASPVLIKMFLSTIA